MSEYDWEDKSHGRPALGESKKYYEYPAEPAYESLANATEHPLLMTACSDYSSFECNLSDVTFKSTLMFQTRVHPFTIQNNGRVSLRLSLMLFNEQGIQIENSGNSKS